MLTRFIKKEEVEKLFFYWLSRAETGEKDAQFITAEFYERGDGVEKDEPLALVWYRRSGETELRAQVRLAEIYAYGQLGCRENPIEAIKWLLAANRHETLSGFPWHYYTLRNAAKKLYGELHEKSLQDIFNFGILLAFHDEKISHAFNCLAEMAPMHFDKLLLASNDNMPHALAALNTDVRECVISRLNEKMQHHLQPLPKDICLFITCYTGLRESTSHLLLKLVLNLMPKILDIDLSHPDYAIYKYPYRLTFHLLDISEIEKIEERFKEFINYMIKESETLEKARKEKMKRQTKDFLPVLKEQNRKKNRTLRKLASIF